MFTQGVEMRRLTLALLPLIAACASGPTPEQLAAADYGAETHPAECTALAEKVIADALKDPSSAQFRSAPCFKGYWRSVPLLGMDLAYGWIQQGEVNGKNVYGGYVGFRPYKALIKNGSVVRYCISDKDGTCMPIGR